MLEKRLTRANYVCYAIVLTAFIVGVGLGASGARGLDAAGMDEASETLKLLTGGLSFAKVFRTVLFSGLLWGALLFVFASAPVLSPFAAVIIAARGFAIGFSSAILMGASQYGAVAAFLLPQCVITLPVMCVLCAMSTQRAIYGGVSLRAIGLLCILLVAAAAAESVVSFGAYMILNR
ncbi:MAG: hypothetical protein Q4C12_05210 [Clostridia bacterium]|nr:hypothetical protein [Clostridia bacterium]